MKLRWWTGGDARSFADEGTEVWAVVPEAVRYAVSNLGRVASSAQGSWKLMTLSTIGAGYRAVGFVDDVGSRNGGALVHRLATRAFDGPPPTDRHTDVRHLDGDKGNNTLPNLLWGTRSENMLDVLRHRQEEKGAYRDAAIKDAESTGTWYGGRTWDTALVEEVLSLERTGYLTVSQAAVLLDVSDHVVSNIARGNSHTYLNVPQVQKQKRRTKAQKEAILALVAEGKNTAEINKTLHETLTAQDVYYYKQQLKR